MNGILQLSSLLSSTQKSNIGYGNITVVQRMNSAKNNHVMYCICMYSCYEDELISAIYGFD